MVFVDGLLAAAASAFDLGHLRLQLPYLRQDVVLRPARAEDGSISCTDPEITRFLLLLRRTSCRVQGTHLSLCVKVPAVAVLDLKQILMA